MQLDNLLCDGETESGATLRLRAGTAELVEFFEYQLLILGGNPGTGISDCNVKRSIANGRLDGYAPGFGELNGISYIRLRAGRRGLRRGDSGRRRR
jgi:hypothetical protein